MNQLKIIKLKTVLGHVVFWVGVWFFFFYFFSYNSENTVYITWFSSALLPLTMGVAYFVNYSLVPKYLLTKKYLRFTLYIFYTLVFSSYIIILVLYSCLILLLQFNVSVMPPMSKNFFFILVLVYLIVGVLSFVNLLNHNFKTLSKNKELEHKILSAQLQLKEQELHYLKRQIHPHFLFNTLNTIYGFALKQSKHTPEIILKLSNLLDYILYQVNKPKVSLKEEVLHIQEYIELEKIRFQETLKVEFEASEINEKIQVAPMLLIPFVENAFKHGNLIDGFLQIKIQVEVVGNKLEFSIQNTVQNYEQQANTNGIGLENIKKRLDLNYNNNYSLGNILDGNWYQANLKIFNLKSND